MKTQTKSTAITSRARRRRRQPQDDYDFPFPQFATEEEREAWLNSLPKVKAEVDPRLKVRVNVTLRLSQKEVDDFDALARQKGLGDGKTLMYVALNQYLVRNLRKRHQ